MVEYAEKVTMEPITVRYRMVHFKNGKCQYMLLKLMRCCRIVPHRPLMSVHPTFITKLVRKVHLPGKVVSLIKSAMQKVGDRRVVIRCGDTRKRH